MVTTDPGADLAVPDPQPGTQAFRCEQDVFEDFVGLDPCCFGVTLGAAVVPLYEVAGGALPHVY